MKTIRLKQLTLLNFKGARDLTVNFDQETNIFGDNETGKTTIFDAFCYLLFGKDSQGKADFNIKTLDEDNNIIWKLPHEVSGILYENETEIPLKKSFNENWSIPTGKTEEVFKGHNTTYYVHNREVSKKDYEETISAIIDENVFKLITNPLAFNSKDFKEGKLTDWETRRNYLYKIAGALSDEDVAKGNDKFEKMLILIKTSGISMGEYKRDLIKKVNELEKQNKEIPIQIKENIRNMPEKQDWSAIEKEILEKEEKIKEIDGKIEDSNKAHQGIIDEITKKNNDIFDLQKSIQEIRFEEETNDHKAKRVHIDKINTLRQDLSSKQDKLKSYSELLYGSNGIHNIHIPLKEKAIADKRKEWGDKNSEQLVFNEDEFNCPACKRPFEVDDIEAKKEEMTVNFNNVKIAKLDEINEEGKKLASELTILKNQVIEYENESKKLTTEKENIEKELKEAELEGKTPPAPIEKSEAEKQLEQQIEEIRKTIPVKPVVDNTELKEAKQVLKNNVDELNKQLGIKDRIVELEERNDKLAKEQKDVAQHIANLQGIKHTIDEFTKVKIDAIEAPINAKFKHARFKMYEQQINADPKECCVTLYKGVPWNDLNDGGRILVGIDIINTLFEYYQVYAPIIIDNRESTTKIPEINTQIINLYVSEKDKTLRIENK